MDEALELPPLFAPALVAQFGASLTDLEVRTREVRATVALDSLHALLQFVRDEPAIDLDYPASVTAIDDGEVMVLLYRLVSVTHGHSLLLKCPVDRTNPIAPTATDLWAGLNWHEREVYDMFGVTFTGHPDLKRILLPDEWVGFPFRKDYVSVPSGNPLEGPQPIDAVGGEG